MLSFKELKNWYKMTVICWKWQHYYNTSWSIHTVFTSNETKDKTDHEKKNSHIHMTNWQAVSVFYDHFFRASVGFSDMSRVSTKCIWCKACDSALAKCQGSRSDWVVGNELPCCICSPFGIIIHHTLNLKAKAEWTSVMLQSFASGK